MFIKVRLRYSNTSSFDVTVWCLFVTFLFSAFLTWVFSLHFAFSFLWSCLLRLRVRTRWSPCSWFPATSRPWSTSYDRTTSPKRVWLCWRPSCPGKDVTEWANQQAASRYKTSYHTIRNKAHTLMFLHLVRVITVVYTLWWLLTLVLEWVNRQYWLVGSIHCLFGFSRILLAVRKMDE